MSEHQINVAFVDWRALKPAERAQVVRAARKGRFHPDARVRVTAQKWARAMQHRPPPRRRLKDRAGRAFPFVLLDWLVNAGGVMSGGAMAAELSEGMFERKTAARLVALEANHRDELPD